MKKPKVTCFRYRSFVDIYVDNVSCSIHCLLALLDLFPNKKVISRIESDVDIRPLLSLQGESIKHDSGESSDPVDRVTLNCNKKELICLLNQLNSDDLEGLFVASINTGIALDRFMHGLKYGARPMVGKGTSDIAIFINFPENQVIVSVSKAQYELKSIKETIEGIFENYHNSMEKNCNFG